MFVTLLAIALCKSLLFSLNHRIHTLLVVFSFFFSSCRVVPPIGSIAPPWALVRTFTKTLFIQRWLAALERWTIPYWASMYTLERESWVQTPLPPNSGQTFAPHAGHF